MKIKKSATIFFIIGLSLVMLSCSKDKSSCYSEVLYQQHKNDICTMDCPGVIGCDGKTYCNECDANRKGIKIK